MIHLWCYTRISAMSQPHRQAVPWHCRAELLIYTQFALMELSVKQQEDFCPLSLILLLVIPQGSGGNICISSVEAGGEKEILLDDKSRQNKNEGKTSMCALYLNFMKPSLYRFAVLVDFYSGFLFQVKWI